MGVSCAIGFQRPGAICVDCRVWNTPSGSLALVENGLELRLGVGLDQFCVV